MPADDALDPAAAQALGLLLQRHRADLQWTQEQVAVEAGISRQHYQLLERGLSNRYSETPANPRLSTLLSLMEVLRIDREELFAVLGPRP